ncbi:hypothetical protein NE237_028532 [Protea cynaroides]|uniref:Uncharacterized protein n=1 Tax=Protea cynaroides TaxID=273540 RepID=A0A9Q0GSK8_9MAGN|nr:hypothetical protein NE237_028532 [Protea cynaroides]
MLYELGRSDLVPGGLEHGCSRLRSVSWALVLLELGGMSCAVELEVPIGRSWCFSPSSLEELSERLELLSHGVNCSQETYWGGAIPLVDFMALGLGGVFRNPLPLVISYRRRVINCQGFGYPISHKMIGISHGKSPAAAPSESPPAAAQPPSTATHPTVTPPIATPKSSPSPKIKPSNSTPPQSPPLSAPSKSPALPPAPVSPPHVAPALPPPAPAPSKSKKKKTTKTTKTTKTKKQHHAPAPAPIPLSPPAPPIAPTSGDQFAPAPAPTDLSGGVAVVYDQKGGLFGRFTTIGVAILATLAVMG